MAYQTIPLEITNQDHRAGLLKLWTENMSDTRISDVAGARLRWFYEENPVEPPRTFLSAYGEKRELVGCGSTFTRRLWALGRVRRAGIPCDFAVTKRHRIGGAAMGIQNALISGSRAGGEDFLFGFPNKMSLPILKRVGYQVVAEARGWVKPLHSLYKLRSMIQRPLVAKAASVAVDAGLRIVDAARALPSWPHYSGAVLDRADGRFDRLWERAHHQYRIVGEKTSTFLNWRYAGFKSRHHRFFALTDRRSGDLAGYVVYTVEDNKVFIVDLFAIDLEATLEPLILRFAIAMRRAGHLSLFITYAGDPRFGERLERLWFRRSKHAERNLVVYVDKTRDEALATELLRGDSWLMFDGEMDI